MVGRMRLYHNPQSRSATAHWMLEEVGAEYETVPIDFDAGDNRKPDFLSVNPMGKIPTLVLADGTVVTETAAIVMHLADAFPERDLAPAAGSSERATYYRWLFFAAAVFEPALTDTMMRKDAEPLPKRAVGWGSYDDVIATLETKFGADDYVAGGRFSAADLYLGAQLAFAGSFGAPRIRDSTAIQAYVGRVTDREAFRRSMAF